MAPTIRDVSAMFDVMPREALWAHIMDTNLLRARQTLREKIIATAPESWTIHATWSFELVS